MKRNDINLRLSIKHMALVMKMLESLRWTVSKAVGGHAYAEVMHALKAMHDEADSIRRELESIGA